MDPIEKENIAADAFLSSQCKIVEVLGYVHIYARQLFRCNASYCTVVWRELATLFEKNQQSERRFFIIKENKQLKYNDKFAAKFLRYLITWMIFISLLRTLG